MLDSPRNPCTIGVRVQKLGVLRRSKRPALREANDVGALLACGVDNAPHVLHRTVAREQWFGWSGESTRGEAAARHDDVGSGGGQVAGVLF